MNWEQYFNTEFMTKARKEIKSMTFLRATKHIRNTYALNLADSIDFAKAFCKK